jgi:hypothetical protein
MPRILFYSSDAAKTVKESDTAETHFKIQPYSIGAIRYNLEKIGWTTAYTTWTTASDPIASVRLINSFKPDIVYSYGSTMALNPLLLRPFCKHRKYIVVHGWDDDYGMMFTDISGRAMGAAMRWMEKRIVKNSDAVVTLSRWNQAKGRRWGVECEYIPNGADIPALDPGQRAVTLDGRFNLVYCGDMARWKRTEDICEAMRHVPADIKLWLTGRHYEYLDPYRSPNCVYLGFLPKAVQLNVMAQADAFVVTADQDCNAKLQEYLRFKKPVLGYDGRLNLFFKNGRNALLTKDYPAAILKLAGDPALCAGLAANAEKDIPVYSWHEIARQFDAYFTKLMSEHKGTTK